MDKEQAEVIRIVADVTAKLMLAGVGGIVFLMLAVALVLNPSWPIALVELLLGVGVRPVFKHYFPSPKSD